jgi:hypothetical protein
VGCVPRSRAVPTRSPSPCTPEPERVPRAQIPMREVKPPSWGGLRPEHRAPFVSVELMFMCYVMWNPPPGPLGENDTPAKYTERLRKWQNKAAQKIFEVNSVHDVPGGMGAWFEDRERWSETAEAKRKRYAQSPLRSLGLATRALFSKRSKETKILKNTYALTLVAMAAMCAQRQEGARQGGGCYTDIGTDRQYTANECGGRRRDLQRCVQHADATVLSCPFRSCHARSHTAQVLLHGLEPARSVEERGHGRLRHWPVARWVGYRCA